MGKRAKISAKKSEAKKENSVSRIRKTDYSQSFSSPIDHILFLQRTIGNQVVQKLFNTGVIQAKLKIGQPNDIYEQEADRVADEVMRMPEPQVQRQSKVEEEEELVQTKPIGDQITPFVQRQVEPEEEEEEPIQAKVERQTPQVTPNIESSINALHGGGQSLSNETRNFFEPRFGQDFSGVRVHADTNANHLARSINARAFTRDNDVVFGGGYYRPGSSNGKRLLGHELTHVVQQHREIKRKSDTPDIMREVRGMVTSQRDGRNINRAEWGVVRTALSDARSMVQRTTSFISGIHNLLFSSTDPRLHTERELNAAAIFRAHYKNPQPLDGLMAQEYFGYISNALNALNRNSFRVVTDEEANQESDGDTYAYVIGRDPTIYLAEAFFAELQHTEEPTTPGVHVTIGPQLINASQKARLLIHETAHFRLGVRHSGGRFGFDVENCAGGLGIRNASQGLDNAYVYDHFAFCASSSAT